MTPVAKETIFLSFLTNRDNFIKVRCAPFFRKEMISNGNIKVYEYIENHYKRYSDTPSKELIESDLAIRLVDIKEIKDSFDYYLEHLVHSRLLNECKEFLASTTKHLVDSDTTSFLDSLSSFVKKIEVEYSKDALIKNINAIGEEVIHEHNRRAEIPGGLDGIPSAWPFLDEATLGWQSTTISYIVAKSSVGKTFFLLLSALHAWTKGYRVLLVSPEMRDVVLLRRLASIATHVPYGRLRKGEATDHELVKVDKFVSDLAADSRFTILSRSRGAVSIAKIEALVEQVKPHLLLIDNFYLLKSTNASTKKFEQQVASLVKDIANLTFKFNLATVCSSQLNREGKRQDKKSQNSDTIAFSGQIEYDADDIYHLYSDADLKQTNRMFFRTLKSRDHSGAHFLLNWNFQTMDFSQICKCYENGDAIAEEAPQEIIVQVEDEEDVQF